MKKLLILLTLLPSLVFAQLTTINPDTVCFGSVNGSIYQVTPTVGLTYNWTVAPPGIITSGPGTNQITVNWSNANPGLIPNAVQVQASNNIGCLSPVVTLDVFIYDVNLILTSLADMCEGGNCVTLVATPTGGVWNGLGVIANQFCPNNSGVGSFNLTYTYSNAGCTFISVMSVNVLAQPMLLPIEHN